MPRRISRRTVPAALLALGWTCAVAGAASAQAQAPEVLTLDEAVEVALSRSPAAVRADAERLQASASRWEGFGRLLPSVAIQTGVSQYDVLQRTATDPITGGIVQLPDSLIELRQRFGTDAALSARWTVFDGGRGRARMQADRAQAEAADQAAHVARARTRAQATLAYLDALEAEATEAVRRAEASRAQELERTAQARFDVGQVPEIDLLQARLAASDAEIGLLQAEGRTRDARRSLAAVIGWPAASEFALAAPDAPDAAEDTDALRSRLLETSPVLAELHARTDAARRQARSERPSWLPSVSVGATWIRTEVGATREAFTLDPRNTQTYYQVSASWSPLQRPAAIVSAARLASAAGKRADADLLEGEHILRREVEAAIDRLERARILRSRAEITLELAERQREQAEERYRLGLAPLVERLAADAIWAAAQQQAVVARHAPLRAVAELELATGAPLRD